MPRANRFRRVSGRKAHGRGPSGTHTSPMRCPRAQYGRARLPGVLGLDRNVGQVTDSNGTLYPMSDLGRLEAKIARKQRLRARKRKGSVRARRLGGQLTKLRRKQKRVRDNDTHHISRALADKAHTLVAEALNTKGMTKSARGTPAQPGPARHPRHGQVGAEPQYIGQQLGATGPAPAPQVWPL